MSSIEQLFNEAQRYIPGGVNSPVRAFGSVGGTPIFINRAEGAYLYGEDGRRYTDYVGSWGPMILGHADPRIIEAVKEAADRGLSSVPQPSSRPSWPGKSATLCPPSRRSGSSVRERRRQ